jgi:hypothetical protein
MQHDPLPDSGMNVGGEASHLYQPLRTKRVARARRHRTRMLAFGQGRVVVQPTGGEVERTAAVARVAWQRLPLRLLAHRLLVGELSWRQHGLHVRGAGRAGGGAGALVTAVSLRPVWAVHRGTA